MSNAQQSCYPATARTLTLGPLPSTFLPFYPSTLSFSPYSS